MSETFVPEPTADDAVAFRRGELNPREYAAAICARIETVDAELEAFVAEPERRERLHAELRELVRRWPDVEDRLPLFGVPIGVKDVLHVDGLPTRAGSRLAPETLAGPEASVVTRLRAAGAVVAGKTVTAEFAFTAPGPTRNPHDRDHTPGGSSSGSAAAVAAGMVPLALGTQTVGSVIRPAAYCGVVGFKPGYRRIPSGGLISNAPTFDTVGFLCRDLELLTAASSAACTAWRVGVRIERMPVLGVPAGPYLEQAEPEALKAFEDQVARLGAAGFPIRRVEMLCTIHEVNQRNAVINLAELAHSHVHLFPTHSERYHETTAAAIREGQQVPRAAYERALAEREEFAAQIVDLMDTHNVDLWIAPAATGPAPEGLGSTGSPVMNLPWTQARFPVITVPVGRATGGLPLGLQCVGRPGADELLLGRAHLLMRALARSR
ncbi:amidase [Actinopolymorpha alba]|uniref:amidase n=1 Tax=Actinopolymorpha alba TaxID=533267 RepID=UPI00035D5442|nr:amidase [Actinopolymorpha alba]